MKRVPKNKLKPVKRVPIKQDPECVLWFNTRFEEMKDDNDSPTTRRHSS